MKAGMVVGRYTPGLQNTHKRHTVRECVGGSKAGSDGGR